ncbi:MAG TPA: penicillin-binding protein 2 [Virgibacillus sp.]|nr:penicillin-binding protein 2 [Virgibacillus sp.]
MDKKKKKRKAQLPFRLNILFLGVFLLFSILILQLGVVQILNGDGFQEEIDRTSQETTKVPVPRGMIYDRNHNVLADNKALYAITFTPQKGVQAEERLEVAEDLAEYITMDGDKLSEQDKIDKLTPHDYREYWYLKHPKKAEKLLTDEEAEEMDNSEQYKEALKRIKDEELEDFSDKELRVMVIKKEMDKASSLTQQVIKNEGVTPDEYARVSENLDKLPGINATVDWDREYPYDDTFSSFLGSITTKEQGIIKENEPYYITRGYSRNDRVGKSGLELEYEDLLRGRKEQIQYTTDKNNVIIDSDTIVEGERGKDLVLTLDVEFQQKVDELVADELKKTVEKYPTQNKHLEDALAVALDPQTGEILAASGQHYDHDENKVEDQSYRILYDQNEPGSSIKGATVLTGYQEDAIQPGEVIVDQPLKIKGSNTITSYGNAAMGPVNDYDALKRSSNIYMVNIAMRLGGVYNHKNGDSLPNMKDALKIMRNDFGQFGLGTRTGIDFPYEATGLEGDYERPSDYLFNAFGQFDTYTTMQLAQYVATIANDGYRTRPHFLKEIHEPTAYDDDLGPVSKSINTEVMNRIQMDSKNIERVQEGFRRVYQEQGGTAYNYFKDVDYNPAGKTGTAETSVFEDGKEYKTDNLALVGYAPFDEPEIAFAVIIPHLGDLGSGQSQRPINHNIGKGILDAYFDLKEERDEDKNK